MPSWKRRGFAKTWPDRAQVTSAAKTILVSSLLTNSYAPIISLTNWWFFVDLAQFREIFSKAKRIAILTGAGVSAESGVPTFRGAGGYWRKWQAQVCNTTIRLHRSVRKLLAPNVLKYMEWIYAKINRSACHYKALHWTTKQTTFSSKYSLKYGGIHCKSLCVANIPLSRSVITWQYCPLDADSHREMCNKYSIV